MFLDWSALTFGDPDHSEEENREIRIDCSAKQQVLFVAHATRKGGGPDHQCAPGDPLGGQAV